MGSTCGLDAQHRGPRHCRHRIGQHGQLGQGERLCRAGGGAAAATDTAFGQFHRLDRHGQCTDRTGYRARAALAVAAAQRQARALVVQERSVIEKPRVCGELVSGVHGWMRAMRAPIAVVG